MSHDTLASNDKVAGREPRDRSLRRFMLWFFACVVVAGGLGFSYKLYEFIHDLTTTHGLRFAGAHILVYLLVAGGFILLLLFAFLAGHFGDIEQAKYDVLETEKRLDQEAFGVAEVDRVEVKR